MTIIIRYNIHPERKLKISRRFLNFSKNFERTAAQHLTAALSAPDFSAPARRFVSCVPFTKFLKSGFHSIFGEPCHKLKKHGSGKDTCIQAPS